MAIILKIRNQKPKNGFALIVAVIFTSVMLAMGLALSTLAYKQIVLSSVAMQSKYAFYAADTGLECALHEDQKNNRFAYDPNNPPTSPPTITCDRTSVVMSSFPVPPTATVMIVFNRLSLDSGTRCADVTVYKYTAPQPPNNATTYIYSLGYDVSCATVAAPDGARVVTRGINAIF